MLATLEQPILKPRRQRTPGTWTPQQAKAAHEKGLAVRRKNSEQRKAIAAKASQLLESINAADPLTHVELALAAAAKRGNAKACEHLALAVSRLRRTPEPVCGPSPLSSGTYTPSNGIAPRQPTAMTPQVTQAVEPKPVQPGVSFAQCREHLVGPAKESLSSVTVGCPGPGEAPRGRAAGGVIESITHTAIPQDQGEVAREIAALEARLTQLRQVLVAGQKQQQGRPQISQNEVKLPDNSLGSVPMVPSGSGVGVQPVEKFCVGGHWIMGVRKK